MARLKTMKRYLVHDLQGGNFMEWTHETPITKNEFRAYLFSIHKDGQMAGDDDWSWNQFTATDGCELWELSLEEAK